MEPSFQPLPRAFYEPDASQVAQALLGHFLLHRTSTGLRGGVIVETEAYLANDPASHGFRRKTSRNGAMYGPPGHAYVYFIYGNHYCFNAVSSPAGVAEAVLVRALEPLFGLKRMQADRRGLSLRHLTNGPGKLCAALAIGREHDRVDLCDGRSPVLVASNPDADRKRKEAGPLVVARRIGISVAADRLLRYYLSGSPYVSRR